MDVNLPSCPYLDVLIKKKLGVRGSNLRHVSIWFKLHWKMSRQRHEKWGMVEGQWAQHGCQQRPWEQ
jgi:hypothetical protein